MGPFEVLDAWEKEILANMDDEEARAGSLAEALGNVRDKRATRRQRAPSPSEVAQFQKEFFDYKLLFYVKRMGRRIVELEARVVALEKKLSDAT